MRPFCTATSAVIPGPPVPSITVPPRTTRSAVIVFSPVLVWLWAAGAGHRHVCLQNGAVGLLDLEDAEVVGRGCHHEQRSPDGSAEHARQGDAPGNGNALGDLAPFLD